MPPVSEDFAFVQIFAQISFYKIQHLEQYLYPKIVRQLKQENASCFWRLCLLPHNASKIQQWTQSSPFYRNKFETH